MSNTGQECSSNDTHGSHRFVGRWYDHAALLVNDGGTGNVFVADKMLVVERCQCELSLRICTMPSHAAHLANPCWRKYLGEASIAGQDWRLRVSANLLPLIMYKCSVEEGLKQH